MKRDDYTDDGLCMALDFSHQRICTETATLKHGVRCTNGCYGEGIFDFYCKPHGERADKDTRDAMIGIYCRDCRGYTLDFFPLQEI